MQHKSQTREKSRLHEEVFESGVTRGECIDSTIDNVRQIEAYSNGKYDISNFLSYFAKTNRRSSISNQTDRRHDGTDTIHPDVSLQKHIDFMQLREPCENLASSNDEECIVMGVQTVENKCDSSKSPNCVDDPLMNERFLKPDSVKACSARTNEGSDGHSRNILFGNIPALNRRNSFRDKNLRGHIVSSNEGGGFSENSNHSVSATQGGAVDPAQWTEIQNSYVENCSIPNDFEHLSNSKSIVARNDPARLIGQTSSLRAKIIAQNEEPEIEKDRMFLSISHIEPQEFSAKVYAAEASFLSVPDESARHFMPSVIKRSSNLAGLSNVEGIYPICHGGIHVDSDSGFMGVSSKSSALLTQKSTDHDNSTNGNTAPIPSQELNAISKQLERTVVPTLEGVNVLPQREMQSMAKLKTETKADESAPQGVLLSIASSEITTKTNPILLARGQPEKG